MRVILVLSLLTVLAPFDCGGEGSSAIRPMPVETISIPNTVPLGQTVSFKLICQTPTPCWKFHHFDITEKTQEYRVVVHAYHEGRVCAQVLSSFTVTGSATPQQRGTFVFKFWRSNAETLDRTVVIQ